MRILLLASHDKTQGKPTLGLLYLAAYARKVLGDFLTIKVVDHLIPLDSVVEFCPDIVGICVFTHQANIIKAWVDDLRKCIQVPIVLGGPHISAMPEWLPATCNVGVIGEGEITFSEVLQHCLEHDGKINPNKLSLICGVVFRNNQGGLEISAPRERVQDLDNIPFPDRDLIELENYLDRSNVFGNIFGRGTHMITSRGCPFECVYCSSNAFWGRRVRYHSPEYVVKEIALLIEKYNVEYIHIYDDLFIGKQSRVKEISDLIEYYGINKKVQFGIYATVNMINDEICVLLKKMGVINIDFGFESGTPRILEFLKAGAMTREQIINAVKVCKKHGFMVGGGFILGAPGETKQEMLDTLAFIKELDLTKFAHYILRPFPGTPLWNIAKEKGIVDDTMDFSLLELKKMGGYQDEKILRPLTNEVSTEDLIDVYNLFEEERSRKFSYRWDVERN
ncbi:MAG: B12-binding domain-containing radical SAM protein [Oligoflexia bacterium]|nr:B12-binding domain-containing radical SAM protein [Oligoflexia bacterium]